jgi:predicted nucleic acid-binding Zn ribbon protein
MNVQSHFSKDSPRGDVFPLMGLPKELQSVDEVRLTKMTPAEISLSDITVRHPATAADFAAIELLRNEINLDLHRQLDPHFAVYEKKEIC